MTSFATLLWLCNLFFDTLGQLSFKAGASNERESGLSESWRAMLVNRWIWLGVAAFLIEFLFWLAFLSLVPLSVGILVGSLNIFTVMVGGRFFFGERLTPMRLTAASLIAVGVACVGWP